MIAIEQWRAVIGCFNPCRKKTLTQRVIVLSGQPISTGLRLVLALSLCIVLSGDVETNPGPGIDQVLAELREFRTQTDRHFETLNGSISSLRSDMANVWSELDTVKEKIRQSTMDMDGMYDECYGQIRSLASRLERLEKSVENQERYSRRDNLLFHDIPGNTDESFQTTTDTLVKVLNENVQNFQCTKDDFIRVHRLRSKQAGKSPIIARFLRSTDKLNVLKSRKLLRDKGIGVSNDMTPRQREELNNLKQQGKRGYYKSGRLVVDNNPHLGNDRVTRDQPSGNHAGHTRGFRFGESQRDFPSRHNNNNRQGRQSSQQDADNRGSTHEQSASGGGTTPKV